MAESNSETWRRMVERVEKAEAEADVLRKTLKSTGRFHDQEKARAEAAEKRAAALERVARDLRGYVKHHLACPEEDCDCDLDDILRGLSALLAPPSEPKPAAAPLGSRCLATSPAGHTCSLPAGHPGAHHGGPQPGYTFR